MRLSGRAYARHRKCTPYAVQKRVKDGTLKDAIDARGLIDPVLADQLWAANTDPSKPLNTVTGDPHHRRGPDGMPTPIGTKGKGQAANEAYILGRGQRETFAAKRERLEYFERRGQLRQRYMKLMETVLYDVLRMLRDQLGGVEDRIQETHGPVVGEAVRREHAEILQAAADSATRKAAETAPDGGQSRDTAPHTAVAAG